MHFNILCRIGIFTLWLSRFALLAVTGASIPKSLHKVNYSAVLA
jgi:hypothetical protein